MRIVEGLAWAAKHAYERKVRQSHRKREWAQKSAPFIHKAESGYTFKLDPAGFVDRFIYIDGIYEKRFLQLIECYFRSSRHRTMLDVGSNIGNHAIYLSKVFKSIHCFDPSPRAARRLKENIEINGLRNIAFHAVGLGDCTTEMPFVDNAMLEAGHFVPEATGTTVKLPVVKGDDHIASLGLDDIDFIKVDVEGHEPQVFDGLRSTIECHRPVIAFEYLGAEMDASSFAAIASMMPGYVFAEAAYASPDWPLLKKLSWHIEHCGRPELKRFITAERRTYENVLAFPDEARFSQALRTVQA